jgi:GT2 family glycosyltransferase
MHEKNVPVTGNPSVPREERSGSMDPSDIPRAVIIIVNWNGRHFLTDCLAAAEGQTYGNYKTILVDNGSTDGSVDFVKDRFPSVALIVLDRNYGFAKANNVAMTEALQKEINYIALLNNDTRADRVWLENMIRVMKSSDDIGMCASKMLLMSDPALIDSTGHVFQSGKIGDRGHGEIDSGQYDNRPDVIGTCAGACLYRGEMLEEIGLFDESFITYYEDAELSWRAHNKGWKARYVPESVVLHHHGGTTRSSQTIDQGMAEQSTINLVKMIRRHDSFVGKLRTSYVWLKTALRGSLEKGIHGRGEGGKPYFDRLKRLWL